MDSCKQAWDDWLQSPNPYAQGDMAVMEAGRENISILFK